MSSEHTGRGNFNSSVTEVEQVSITHHAALRYTQRCDPAEAFPKERIRQIVDEGRWVRLSNFAHPAKMLDGVAAVVDRAADQVITVLRPRKHQLEAAADASAGWREEYHHQGVGARGHE